MPRQATDREILEAVKLLTQLADVDHSDKNLKTILDSDCKFKSFLNAFADIDKALHSAAGKEYDYNHTLTSFIEASIGDDVLEYASHWLMVCKLIKERRILLALVRQDNDDSIDPNDGVQISIDLSKCDTSNRGETIANMFADLASKPKTR